MLACSFIEQNMPRPSFSGREPLRSPACLWFWSAFQLPSRNTPLLFGNRFCGSSCGRCCLALLPRFRTLSRSSLPWWLVRPDKIGWLRCSCPAHSSCRRSRRLSKPVLSIAPAWVWCTPRWLSYNTSEILWVCYCFLVILRLTWGCPLGYCWSVQISRGNSTAQSTDRDLEKRLLQREHHYISLKDFYLLSVYEPKSGLFWVCLRWERSRKSLFQRWQIFCLLWGWLIIWGNHWRWNSSWGWGLKINCYWANAYYSFWADWLLSLTFRWRPSVRWLLSAAVRDLLRYVFYRVPDSYWY